jgi:hypothetical protein
MIRALTFGYKLTEVSGVFENDKEFCNVEHQPVDPTRESFVCTMTRESLTLIHQLQALLNEGQIERARVERLALAIEDFVDSVERNRE